jgi:DNA topoisomerase-1
VRSDVDGKATGWSARYENKKWVETLAKKKAKKKPAKKKAVKKKPAKSKKVVKKK